MTEVKHWKSSPADEAWMVMISARDHLQAETVIHNLVHLLVKKDYKEACIDDLRQFTGDQIVNGLLAYKDSCLKCIEKAVERKRSDCTI